MINNEKNDTGYESSDIIDIVAREAEQFVAESCEAARQEAEQELEKALHEYEQRTKQIVLKIKEEAKSRTAEIAGRLSEAIMTKIEKSSTDSVAEVIADFSEKAGQLTRTLQKAVAGEEDKQVLAEAKVGNDTASDNNGATRKYETKNDKEPAEEDLQETEKTKDVKSPGFEIEVESELASITEDKANGKSQLDNEEFENWLAQ